MSPSVEKTNKQNKTAATCLYMDDDESQRMLAVSSSLSGRKIAKKGHFAKTPCKQFFFFKCREFCGESTVKTLPKNFHGKVMKT